MNIVLIIPTGIGAEIGGHAGDGNPVAKLMASTCDNLITHPNVVNASDINEMTENTLYVEGSTLDRFLWGEAILKRPAYNRVLVAVNAPIQNETINAVSAAKATIGMDVEIIELAEPLEMIAGYKDGRATGQVNGWQALVKQVKRHEFDALAVVTPITVEEEIALQYLKNGGVNPWGGVEAEASRLIATSLNKPVAHAPMGETLPGYKEIVDPRIAAEMVSVCYLHCVLKGLHRAPRINDIGEGLKAQDIDFMVSPGDCYGTPHEACLHQNIPIIYVKENKTIETACPVTQRDFLVDNYIEAAGLIMAMKAGVHWSTVRRPLRRPIIKGSKRVED